MLRNAAETKAATREDVIEELAALNIRPLKIVLRQREKQDCWVKDVSNVSRLV